MICTHCSHGILGDSYCSKNSGDDNFHILTNSVEIRKNDYECKHFKTHNIYELIDENIIHNGMFLKIKRFISSLYSDIKYGVVLKMKYGFDIRDTWNLDTAICNFIKPRLDYFIERGTQGYPGYFCDIKYVKKFKISIYFSKPIKDLDLTDEHDLCVEAWMNVLKTIQFSIDKIVEDECVRNENEIEKIEEGTRLLGIFLENLWN